MSKHPGSQTICILDSATVNKIAAGEVVERPASVVKELVENAIDAGAQKIKIEIQSGKGAITGIRVTDDGSGMSQEDAVIAFAPHATSKISHISDLDTIRSLGFRGEALTSIAAVSQVTLCTKPREMATVAGTKVIIEGGEIRERGEIGTPEGTTILIENLFFNIPVRKKFLKSLATELAHINGIVEGLALSHPNISMHLIHNGHEQIVTEQSSRILDTIARLYGSELVKDLIPVEHNQQGIFVSGYISRPSLFRKNQSRLLLFINGRYVSSHPINAAIVEGYGTLLSKERFPVAFLSLDIDTKSVDVNVHPTKKQVRLSREVEVCSAVRGAVSHALLNSDLIPTGTMTTPNVVTGLSTPTPYEASYNLVPIHPSVVREPTHAGIITTERQLRQTELPTGIQPAPSLVPELEVIGQIGGIYILATTPSGDLILVDQHAAHERIMYELVSMKSESMCRSQELIVPVTLHRSARDAAIMRELLPALAEEGFLIEDFGKDSFLVRAIPVVLGTLEQTGLVNEILDDLSREEPGRFVSNRERIVRIIACHSAIKAGTVCTPDQYRRLLQQLRKTKNPFSCPHGRPVMIRFSREQLDTMFKRT
jgi:DNA mismatch repair protein MutL